MIDGLTIPVHRLAARRGDDARRPIYTRSQNIPIVAVLFDERSARKPAEAQARIDSVPYVLVFTPAEKKIILSLRESADDIVFRGIPLIKRDFYRVLTAARQVADEKRKHPLELMPDPAFRNTVYRRAEPVPKKLDEEMAKLSKG